MSCSPRRAWQIVDAVAGTLRDGVPGIGLISAAGELRRAEPTVSVIEIVAAAESPAAAVAAVRQVPSSTFVGQRGRSVVLLVHGYDVRIHLAPPARFGNVLLHRTGSRAHYRQLQRHAAAAGLRLQAAALFRDEREIACPTEEGLYGALRLPFIDPELRHASGEVAAAAGGRLPRLVCPGDLRGDLHLHTSWSDGRDSLETMVATAQGLGYEYVAITDHSRSSIDADGLSAERLLEQGLEIERVRARFPGLTIFHGCEVDIRPDGQLDYPDGVLERLDIVLTSLHDRGPSGSPPPTELYLAAMRHPLVHIVTHPTNRLIGAVPGYDLDLDALFRMAVDTGTALEINGAPAHLDLDGPTARRAAAAGVTLSIDSDSHRAAHLAEHMRLGIAAARRGWIQADQVLNTRTAREMHEWLSTP